MSVDNDGECADIWEEDIRRSRKDRKCDACSEMIKRGDKYCSTRSLYDGRWNNIDRCARCETMYRVLSFKMPELRDEYYRPVCDPELDCGHTWEDNFKSPPPAVVATLAFLTQAEAQVLLKIRWDWRTYLTNWDRSWYPAYLQGPEELPEHRIARTLGWIEQEHYASH